MRRCLREVQRFELRGDLVEAIERRAIVVLVVALDQLRRDAVDGPWAAEKWCDLIAHVSSPRRSSIGFGCAPNPPNDVNAAVLGRCALTRATASEPDWSRSWRRPCPAIGMVAQCITVGCFPRVALACSSGGGAADRPSACSQKASATVLTYSPNGISAVRSCFDNTISGGGAVISMRNRLDRSRVAQSLDGRPSGGESACPRRPHMYAVPRRIASAEQQGGRDDGYRVSALRADRRGAVLRPRFDLVPAEIRRSPVSTELAPGFVVRCPFGLATSK